LVLINGGKNPPIPTYISIGIAEINTFSKEDVQQLHALEYNKLMSLKNSKRRNEFVASRLLMKKLAGENMIPSLYIAHQPNEGSPYGIQNMDGTKKKWELSISHSKNWVCCALSDTIHPVGVDIEPVSRRIPIRLKDRFLHTNEQGHKHYLAEQEPVIKLWTLKEAVVKLLKTGLRTNLNSIELRRLGDNLFKAQYRSHPEIQVISIKRNEHFIALAFYADE